MLFSRFWYLFLAVVATACAAAALLAQGIVNDRSDNAMEDGLRRDRAALDVQLALDARSRIDRLAFISVDSTFGALLRQATGVPVGDKRLAGVAKQVKSSMHAQVGKLKEAGHPPPDLAFAIDLEGRIVAQLGPYESNEPGGSLATFPLVRRALLGYVRDDVWLYDRKVYRMAARPVMSGREYAGAVVHGYLFDNTLAAKLSENLQGASLAFFHGNTLLGSQSAEGAPDQSQIVASLQSVLKLPELTQEGKTNLLPLGEFGQAVYALLPGSAATADVGMVLARGSQHVASPLELFTHATQQDLDHLPIPMLAAGGLLAALLGLLAVYLERDRPFGRLRKAASEMAAGNQGRFIITDFGGHYRSLADNINQTLDRTLERAADMAPTTKKKANLDDLLGPTPGTPDAQPFFGFATDTPAVSGGEGAVELPTREIARAPSPPPPAPPEPRAAAPAMPAPRPPAAAPRMPALPTPALPAAPAPATRPVPSPPARAVSAGHDEGAHFREVYEQYLATRRQCDEAVDNLTFEKFEGTLIKTRDQILSKHDGKGVRFTVYVKDGKAALKASPLR